VSVALPLFPHRVADRITLRLQGFEETFTQESVIVSGPPSSTLESDGERPTPVYTLAGSESWRRLGFGIEARLSPEQLTWAVPPGIDPSADARMIVQLTCPSTKLRRGIQMRPESSGAWRGEAVLGERARLELDPSTNAAPSSVEVVWEDFESSSSVWRRAHAHDVFSLAIEDRPIVYLNSRYHELRDVLESTSKRGPQAAQRELTAALIAHPVLVQLSSIAILCVDLDDQTQTVTKPSGWRGDLLDALLPSLYPASSSVDAALLRLGEDTQDSFMVGDLFGRLGSSVQRMISTHETVETAIRAFESTRDEGDIDAD
jgi:hypothetical protein